MVEGSGEVSSDDGSGEIKELEAEFEKELCDLWDMSVERDVCLVLDHFNAVHIFDGFVRKYDATCPRACEILIGVLVRYEREK